jgi:DNA-binding transcriptional ArsR family regulator
MATAMAQPTLDVFQVIADPSRREMLRLLSKDSLTINSLAENFDMSRPAVSKHIKILYTAGFITIQDIGRERYCTLKQDGFNELQEWISYFDKFWGSKLQKLEALLNSKIANKK